MKKVNPTLAVVAIVLAAVSSFLPSLNGDFVFDDTEAILNNLDVLPTSPIGELFVNDFWGRPLKSNFSHKSYRPLTVLTFRFNYYLAKGFYSTGFHIFNLVLHATVSVILLPVYNVIIHQELFQRNTSIRPQALYASLIFACHPVHAENVAGIVGRADMLCAFFFFAAFLLFFSFCSSNRPLMCHCVHSLLFVAFAVCATFSMLSKEQGITIIGVCIVYDFITNCRKLETKDTLTQNRRISNLALRTCLLLLLGTSLLAFRLWIMGNSLPIFQEPDNPASFAELWWQRAINFNYIYSLNVWLLIYSGWLCFDWSMGCIPLINGFSDFRIVFPIILWAVLIYFIFYCIRNWRLREARCLMIALVIMVMPFLPASNLLVKVGFVVAERILYISSAGFCLVISLGLKRLQKAFRLRFNLSYFIGITILTVFMLRNYQRSQEWCTEERLFSSALHVCPLNAKVHYNIAKNAADNGNREVAIERYKEALRLHPTYDQAMNNLANILKDTGELHPAETLLLRAVQIRPDFAAAWMNLGIVQSGLKQYREAEQSYMTAILLRPVYPDCYYNLGNLYLQEERYNDAEQAWQTAIRHKPTLAVAWNNMIIMLDNIGQIRRAKEVAEKAVSLFETEASIHFNYANILGKLGEYETSEKHFLKAIKLNDSNHLYYTNLGVMYHRWKRYSEAESSYRLALHLNPDSKSTLENLNLLLNAKTKKSMK